MHIRDFIRTYERKDRGDTRRALAKAAGVTVQAIKSYENRKAPKYPRPARCHLLVAATGGKVTLQDLNPDVFGIPAPESK
jgi:transcriptional regulator with XRE-family HTH domain